MTLHEKDRGLAHLANRGNVAQFASFGPDLKQRFARIRGYEPDHDFSGPENAIDLLLRNASGGTVNVRSFHPEQAKGRSFDYGLESREGVLATLRRRAAEGLHTIVNETIDVHDGGVSGVVLGGVVEFAPDDTPRCVEKPGTARLPLTLAESVFKTVYGFELAFPMHSGERLEFSIHPNRVGYRLTHTLLWEIEEVGTQELEARPAWPNLFSMHIGDKAFGLLIGHLLGLPVPFTTVIARRVAPFAFGSRTGTAETWLRTCPREQQPGRFTTTSSWTDPYLLLQKEDPDAAALASVLAQEAVDALWSGATAPTANGHLIEGVAGKGDIFMLGEKAPDHLPQEVRDDVQLLLATVGEALGPIRIEWVHDGNQAWLVQLHIVRELLAAEVIYPGDALTWHDFEVTWGLPALRELADRATRTGGGILVRGDVGVTSHVGDVLRKARVPARFA